MALDGFLKIDGIPGDCPDDKHKEWISILSCSTGVSLSGGGLGSAQAIHSSGRASLTDFCITKRLDKSSKKLMLACCRGQVIPTVTVELCRATGTGAKQAYMAYKMNDVVIAQVDEGVSASDESPTEGVSFRYGKMEWTFTPTDARSGSAQGAVAAKWDSTTNTGA